MFRPISKSSLWRPASVGRFASEGLLALMATSCMTGPTVDSLPNQARAVELEGYTLSGSHEVQLDCKQVGMHGLVSFATTTSAAEPLLKQIEGSLYPWSTIAEIPAACWIPVAPGVAAARVYATDTDEEIQMVHVEDMACVLEELASGETYAHAGLTCAERFHHRELHAPSGLSPMTDPLHHIGPVTTAATGFLWAEGPLWDADDGALVFTDVARDTILRLEGRVLTRLIGGTDAFTNGLDYDAGGNRIECQHRAQRVVVRTPSGEVTVVADTYGGLPFNSPNDAIGHASGAIFFTDPTYGSLPELGGVVPQQPHQGVYRVAPGSGEVTLVDPDRIQPNGIALSPHHTALYVADTEGDVVIAYPVTADGTTGAGAWFADVAAPDGIAVDVNGNVYVAGSAGVVVLRSDGTAWGTIGMPSAPTNVAFGGDDRRTLFATAPHAVYRVELEVPGLPASF